MPYKFFVIPIHDDGEAEAALNRFLRSKRILSVDRRWVDQGSTSFWSFCIDFHDGPATAGPNGLTGGRPLGAKPRIDYREVLPPEQFKLFALLRDLRKDLAHAEAVPVYTIFTNEQLAQMVQQRAKTRADLAKIDGIGEARLDKYASRFLDALNNGDLTDETCGPPVPPDHRP